MTGGVLRLVAAQRLQLGEAGDVLLDVEAGAWALLYRVGDTWRVRQGGPARLWDDVEKHIMQWQGAGAPGLDRFGLMVPPNGDHRFWLDAPDCPFPATG
ncbi:MULTISPECIES: hypothetical protein [unclassified Streptomyces]|uniref:hypothetical protein n=1 Tax=unclassified Streptomyces TaxID=2593676 RepID=UPI00382C77E4